MASNSKNLGELLNTKQTEVLHLLLRQTLQSQVEQLPLQVLMVARIHKGQVLKRSSLFDTVTKEGGKVQTYLDCYALKDALVGDDEEDED